MMVGSHGSCQFAQNSSPKTESPDVDHFVDEGFLKEEFIQVIEKNVITGPQQPSKQSGR